MCGFCFVLVWNAISGCSFVFVRRLAVGIGASLELLELSGRCFLLRRLLIFNLLLFQLNSCSGLCPAGSLFYSFCYYNQTFMTFTLPSDVCNLVYNWS